MINRLLFVKVFNYWWRKIQEICNPNIKMCCSLIIVACFEGWMSLPQSLQRTPCMPPSNRVITHSLIGSCSEISCLSPSMDVHVSVAARPLESANRSTNTHHDDMTGEQMFCQCCQWRSCYLKTPSSYTLICDWEITEQAWNGKNTVIIYQHELMFVFLHYQVNGDIYVFIFHVINYDIHSIVLSILW